MEVPIEAQRAAMDPAKQFTSFSVDLDFQDVAFNPEFDDAAVSVQVPEKGRLVRRFVPPPPAAPSTNLGKPLKEFSFTDAKGAKVTLASLKGKVCVFDFWASDCAPCKEHTPLLEKAYQEFKSADDVAFYGVSTDPKGLPTEAVEKTLQSWGATFGTLGKCRRPCKESPSNSGG
jgi:thiol-disulfide isomerase/thioredoxin